MSYLVLSIPKKVLKWMLILQVSETKTFNFIYFFHVFLLVGG